MYESACVCVRVWQSLALCSSVILLSTWTIGEQLAWPPCALQHRVEERILHNAFRYRNQWGVGCWTLFLYLFPTYLLCCLSFVFLPQVTGGALLALLLRLSSWFNTSTDVEESLRGPIVPLVRQQGLGAAGEDFSNQFYWSYAIGLTQQGQAQPSGTSV